MYPTFFQGHLDLNEVQSVTIHYHEGHPYIKKNSNFPSLEAAHQAIVNCFQYQVDQGATPYDKLCFTLHFALSKKDLTDRLHLGFDNENPLICDNIFVDFFTKKDIAWEKWKQSRVTK